MSRGSVTIPCTFLECAKHGKSWHITALQEEKNENERTFYLPWQHLPQHHGALCIPRYD